MLADDMEKKQKAQDEAANPGMTKKAKPEEESWGAKWKRQQDAREKEKCDADVSKRKAALKKQLDGKRMKGRRLSEIQQMQLKYIKGTLNLPGIESWWVRDQLVVHGITLTFPHQLVLHPPYLHQQTFSQNV